MAKKINSFIGYIEPLQMENEIGWLKKWHDLAVKEKEKGRGLLVFSIKENATTVKLISDMQDIIEVAELDM